MLKRLLYLMQASESHSSIIPEVTVCSLLFYSMNLLGTVSKALGNTRKIQMMASLDHSMWFYEPFDMSKPLLFFMQTQVSSNGRGLAMGRFYSQEGTLLAIVVCNL